MSLRPVATLCLFAGLALVVGCSDASERAAKPAEAPAASGGAKAGEPARAIPSTPTPPPPLGPGELAFDHTNSSVEFVGAKLTGAHLGGFKSFRGTLSLAGGEVAGGKVSVEIDATSVYADSDKLAGHLKAPDFFDVAKFATVSFVSTSVVAAADAGTYTVTGDLNFHGVTKSISFPAVVTAGQGHVIAKAQFGLNRQDFGIRYPGRPDDLIKDEVVIKLAVRASAPPKALVPKAVPPGVAAAAAAGAAIAEKARLAPPPPDPPPAAAEPAGKAAP